MGSRRLNPSEDDFGELLRDGLSSSKSYVVLKEKNRSPVYLCFKPFIRRLRPQVLYIGGKLSAFIDASIAGEMNSEELEEKLNGVWRKLPRDRTNGRRIGSNAGFLIACGTGETQMAKFLQKFEKAHVVHALLDGIEAKLGVEIANRNEVVAYLAMVYRNHLPGYGEYYGQGGRLTDRQIGKKTEVLIGQTYVSGGDELEKFIEAYSLTPSSETSGDADAA